VAPVSGLARAALAAAVRPYEGLTTTPPESITRYALDPFAHCDDGHVIILDLVTLDEVPFEPWPHQRDLAEQWIDLERLRATGLGDDGQLDRTRAELRFFNLHVEKSRQEGITWDLAWLVHWVMTYWEAPGGYQHLDLEEVDDGGRGNTVKSFFGKVRFINDRMPERWRPPLRFRGGSSPSIRHAHRARAVVYGEGRTPDPARGGRLAWFLQDEAARLPFDRAATAALTRAAPTARLQNSTPRGEDNEYYRMRNTRPRGWRFVRYHWSEHPLYSIGLHVAGADPDCEMCRGNMVGLEWEASDPRCHRYPGRAASPWYDEAVIELTDEQVAQELDIDYAGSLEARVYPTFSEERHVLDAAAVRARLGLDPRAPYDADVHAVELSFDYGIDTTAVGIFQDAPGEYRKIGELEMRDSTPDEVVPALREVLAELGVPLRLLEREWTLQWLAVGDPAGEARQAATGRPLTAEYRRLGFHIRSRQRRIAETISATKRLLQGRPKPLVILGPTCPETIRHLKGNTWPVDRDGRRKQGAAEPVNDEHNHMMRADAYLYTWKFPPPPPEEDLAEATRRVAERRREARPGLADEAPDFGGQIDPGLSPDMKL
jgi:hypothetical protein